MKKKISLIKQKCLSYQVVLEAGAVNKIIGIQSRKTYLVGAKADFNSEPINC